MTVKREDLVVATQGRSFWILDDLTPLRQWNDDGRGLGRAPLPAASDPAHGRGAGGRRPGAAPGRTDMPAGVVVDYWLKDAPR